MFHLRLIKGLSYFGIVSATKKNPDVYTDDKATADKAVASGYFVLVSAPITEEVTAEPPKKATAKKSSRKEN